MMVSSVWLWVSGVFFVLGSVAMPAALLLVLRVLKSVNDMEPKVRRISDRLESMSEKLEGMATSAKSSVDSVGASTKALVGSVEGAVVGSAARFEKVLGVLVLGMSILKLVREFQEVRRPRAVDKGRSDEA
jgi:hypothetical protein